MPSPVWGDRSFPERTNARYGAMPHETHLTQGPAGGWPRAKNEGPCGANQAGLGPDVAL